MTRHSGKLKSRLTLFFSRWVSGREYITSPDVFLLNLVEHLEHWVYELKGADGFA
jgi:hypothetical protein